jgi:DNA-binding transcriptional MerR regulator
MGHLSAVAKPSDPTPSGDRGGHTDKAPEAFRTISEVADDLDLPQHVLRFWETRFAQIRPLKRGGGRRYYRPEDVDLLRGIKHLLYGEGYTIKGVQRILKSQGLRFVQNVWRDPTSLAATAGLDRDARDTEMDGAVEEVAPEPDDHDEPGVGSPAPVRPAMAVTTPSVAAPRLNLRPAEGDSEPRPLSREALEKLKRALLDLEDAKRLLDATRGIS